MVSLKSRIWHYGYVCPGNDIVNWVYIEMRQADRKIENNDKIEVWWNHCASMGYLIADLSLDTQVNNQDKVDMWNLHCFPCTYFAAFANPLRPLRFEVLFCTKKT